MGGTFVITLREGFEAALILGLIYTYLEKIGARREFRYVTAGAVLGVVGAASSLGASVTLLSGPLVDLGPDLIGAAVVLFAASGTLTWHGWWMRRHARAVRGELERRIDAAQAHQQFWVVGVIAFTGVFREGAETVLFLWGLLTQVGNERGELAARPRRRAGRRRRGGRSACSCSRAPGRSACGGSSRGPRCSCSCSPPASSVPAWAGSRDWASCRSADTLWDTSGWLDERSFLGSLLAGLLATAPAHPPGRPGRTSPTWPSRGGCSSGGRISRAVRARRRPGRGSGLGARRSRPLTSGGARR